MIDNWTLQDVASILADGMDTRTAGEITVSPDRQKHTLSPVPAGVLQIDSLLGLLTNIVCFDSLTVDTRFVDAWQQDESSLLPLTSLGVVTAVDYSELGGSLVALRESIVDELCVTPTLAQAMETLREEWKSSQTSSDPHLSAALWGGAGMLARSHLTETPYFGHPVRRRLISETRLFSRRKNAAEVVTTFLQAERAKMFRFRGQQLSGSVAHMSLPPIAVRAIEDSDNLAQLVPAALNLRDQHRELREWLAHYQEAIDLEDEKEQLKRESLLRDVAQSLRVKYGAEKSGGTGLSISTAFFKLHVSRFLVDAVKNSFGVRSTLCKLLLAPRGEKALGRLLTMLGEGKSLLGRNVLQDLQARYSGESTAAGA